MGLGKLMMSYIKKIFASPSKSSKLSEQEAKIKRSDGHEMNLDELFQGSGLGKTQFFLWGLQFLIALVHLSIYFMTTILIPYLRCEWGFNTWVEVAVGSALPMSVAVSGVVAGNLADKVGRRMVLLVTTVFLAIGSIMIVVSPNVWVLLVALIIQGICTGIAYPVCFVYSVEITASNNKELAVMIVYLGQFGGVFLSTVSYFAINNIGWRYVVAVISCPFIVILIGLIMCPETPRYLLVHGKGEEAIQSLKKIYEWNGDVFPKNCVSIKKSDIVEKAGKLLDIFSFEYRKPTILLTTTLFANFYISLAFAAYLPLASENTKESQNIYSANDTSCQNILDKKALAGNIVAFFGDVLGVLLSGFLAKRVGRKFIVIGFSLLALLCTIAGFFDLNQTVKMILNMLLRLVGTGLRYRIYLMTLECYPTVLRSTASTFIHSLGDAGGTVGSFLTYLLYPVSPESVVSLFVGAAAVQLMASVFLNTENKDLADHTKRADSTGHDSQKDENYVLNRDF
ncbi:synaptic vesicle 2-related protein-like [Bolinopsis microptera]|uniref:synaptic vesicle 2-related protein-like n=1 Tax=Bolinopsis microptera TaxID=2820187 RepID=UPI00307A133E